MICKHKEIDNLPFHNQKHCLCCGKSEREIELENTLSEVLSIFRDEDVVVSDEMKSRWLAILEKGTGAGVVKN